MDSWRAAGSPAQPAISWPRQRWTDALPGYAQVLAGLPDWLGRPQVRQSCRNAAGSPVAALEAFIAVMARGYGRAGYGPFRVSRVLASAADPGARLQAAAGELALVAGCRGLSEEEAVLSTVYGRGPLTSRTVDLLLTIGF